MPEDAYARGSAQVIGSLLMLAAREYEGGADMLVWENNEIRKLLGAGWALIDDKDISKRLKDAADSKDENLLISALEKNNDQLKRMLIDLHSEVEKRNDEANQKMNRQIWQFLRITAEKHRLDFF